MPLGVINIYLSIYLYGISPSNIIIFNTHSQEVPDGFRSWEVLLQAGKSDWIRFDDEKSAKSATAALLCTSSTSGLPKVAAMSHHALVAANIQTYDSKHKPYKVSSLPRPAERPIPMQQITRLLCLLQYHSFILPLPVLDPLREGATTYLMRRFSLPKYLDYIQRFQITKIPNVPPILLRILH
jgi:4-coumarate--CoA ligase